MLEKQIHHPQQTSQKLLCNSQVLIQPEAAALKSPSQPQPLQIYIHSLPSGSLWCTLQGGGGEHKHSQINAHLALLICVWVSNGYLPHLIISSNTKELLIWGTDFLFHIISNRQKICKNIKAPPYIIDPNSLIAYFLPHLFPHSLSIYITIYYSVNIYYTFYIFLYI